MKLQIILPVQELRPYILRIWLAETDNGLTDHGTLVAPNAKPKIMIAFKNAISATDHNKTDYCKEGNICFIGIRDVPINLITPRGATGSIGVEFKTEGAYRFLRNPMNELANNMFSFSDVYGHIGRELIEMISNEKNPIQKIKIIQDFLIKIIHKTNRDNCIIDYSTEYISSLKGLTTIKELERKTGYSSRYLEMLFNEYLGVSPKTLITIYRFQRFYKALSNYKIPNLPIDNIYDFYYDQAHYIREFKRYTGYTPVQYSKFNNDFGKIF